MSIMKKKFSNYLIIVFLIQIFAVFSLAQNLQIRLKLNPGNSSDFMISGKFSPEVSEKNLLFLLSYADSENLGSRISNVQLFDDYGQIISHKKIAEGTFAAEKPFSSFSYRINAAIPPNILSVAHISWISGQKGILRTNDLLPTFAVKYKTNLWLELPPNWKTSTTEESVEQNKFFIRNIENAVFIVGRGWSRKTFQVSGVNVNLILDDQWNIEKTFVEKITKEILLKYENYFGAIPNKNLSVINFRFPKDVCFERWRAEATGSNIIIMSAPTTFESQIRQRMQEQLRHEIFHLWMPNNLALKGDYGWFYEGFAQYTALKTGIALNQISFRDFLNTLEQAYNLGNRRSQPISLIQASKNRWLSENSSVYSKGLAVAFLFDIALIKQSGGRRDLISLLNQIYEKHKNPNKPEDANTAIIKFFENYKELSPIINDYVLGPEKLNFEKYLTQTGIEISTPGTDIKFRVKDDLSGREKDFLNKLGYNNWRKTLSK